MNKQIEVLKIIIPADADYSEIVDSVTDLLEVGIIIETALGDGFQFKDLFALLGAEPKIQEIINDVPVFLEQFLKLNQDTAKASVIEARLRILQSGKKFGKVTKFVASFLFAAANSYAYAADTYIGGQTQFFMWQNFIKGGDIFPPLKPAK